MPAQLVAKGYSVGVSSQLLAASALIAVPTVFVAACALQPLEQQGGAGRLDRAHRRSASLGMIYLELASPATPARCCRSRC